MNLIDISLQKIFYENKNVFNWDLNLSLKRFFEIPLVIYIQEKLELIKKIA